MPRLSELRWHGGVLGVRRLRKRFYRAANERFIAKLFAVICSCLQLFAVSRDAEK
jgi:hypothetical protein